MLLSAIPVLLLREIWHLLLHLGPRSLAVVEHMTAVLFGAAIIVLAIKLFSTSNLIFADVGGALARPYRPPCWAETRLEPYCSSSPPDWRA